MKTTQQMEIRFEHAVAFHPAVTSRRVSRRNRARWWFAQMRAVVDAAFDWQSAPAARPEQRYLGLAIGR